MAQIVAYSLIGVALAAWFFIKHRDKESIKTDIAEIVNDIKQEAHAFRFKGSLEPKCGYAESLAYALSNRAGLKSRDASKVLPNPNDVNESLFQYLSRVKKALGYKLNHYDNEAMNKILNSLSEQEQKEFILLLISIRAIGTEPFYRGNY